ncbi:hypothetical protein L2Z53_11870 (plasmid) [Macrococcoides canis]|uniref:hypothetical protein n=1 Tax=Macrococcoides canis TaxID=1855823 RepID=UPI001F41A59A|nr:hypothetical protein [Macrococcus canis]UJS29032.1 hypothetical protein L2Z53_11870 [Macrococcus canis]
MFNYYSYEKIRRTLKNFYEREFWYDENVDLTNMNDDLDNFKCNGVISLAYGTDNEDIFSIDVYLNLYSRSIISKVSSVHGLEKLELLFSFDNENQLIQYLNNATFESLVIMEQEDLYIKYNHQFSN